MVLRLETRHLTAIRRHGETAYPRECCGFLLGSDDNGFRRVCALAAVENVRTPVEQRTRYLIPADAYRRAEREARSRGFQIVGFYHSHPDVPAHPSAYDTEHAWPWYSYLIVSVCERRATEVAAWRLRDDRSGFNPEELAVE
jgi:proteasome lid subunit RPN8/RPN11